MYWILIIFTTLIGMIAQSVVQSTFNKYSRQATQAGRSAREVADSLINWGSGQRTAIVPARGSLTDHFDPTKNTVALSEPVYNSPSVSAVAVAAHECGHVMQHREGYSPLRARNALVPVFNLLSNMAMPMMLVGLFIGISNIIWLGVLLYGVGFVFQLVTLPVELNASSRALWALEDGGYLAPEELPAARKVLRAAAMTYVCAALASALQLLYLLSIAGGNRNRRG